MKSTATKQRYRMKLCFVVFFVIVLLPSSMSKLIHSRCKLSCKLLKKIIRLLLCMQTDNWVPVFYVLVRYSLLFSPEIIHKQSFASGSVNVVE